MKNPFHKKIDPSGDGPKPIPKSKLGHEIRNDPFLDWALILGLTLVVSLGLVAVSVSMYLDVSARLSKPSVGVAKINRSAIDVAALDQVLSDYEARARERDSIIRGYSAPRDPSLP